RGRALAARDLLWRARPPRPARGYGARAADPHRSGQPRDHRVSRRGGHRARLGSRPRAGRSVAQDGRPPSRPRRRAASMFVWLNGRVVRAAEARVSALDRGLLHGDGVYDTWRTYGGQPFAVREHVRRIERTARFLGLSPVGSVAQWEHRSRLLARRNGLAEIGVRLTITRGACGLELLPRGSARPTGLLTARPLPTGLGPLPTARI